MLAIDITPFKSGVHHVEKRPDPEEVELEPDEFEHLYVQARLDCHRDRILVTLRVQATATLTCDRTLRNYKEEIEGTYRVLFGPERLAGQESDRYDEVRPFDPSNQEIEITDLVRDTLLLSIPHRKVAPGAEEEEITTQFGAPEDEEEREEDIDPRWEALRELRDEEE